MRLVRAGGFFALAAAAALAVVFHNQDDATRTPEAKRAGDLPQAMRPDGASAKSVAPQGQPTAVQPVQPPAPASASSRQPLVPLTLDCTENGKCGDCRTAADCAPGQGCLLDYTVRKLLCLNSDCKTDDDCAEGQVCLPHFSPTGPTIRRCAEVGFLPEGATCIDPTAPPEARCALGLVCVLGRCGRECDPKTKTPCTDREYCIIMQSYGSGCFPFCSIDSDCDGGLVCRQKACVRVIGLECDALRCLPPSRCEGSVAFGVASYECVTSCNPLLADAGCPEGFLCGALGTRSRCYQRCTSSNDNACPSGQVCGPVVEDGTEEGCVSSARIHRVLVPAHAH
jgi:hypothetical protein